MEPARILVTGAGGFVGRHLVPALGAAFPGAAVTGTALTAHDGCRALDLGEPQAVRAAVRALRPDACIHLAAISAVPAARQDPARAWRVNLHGTLALAEAIGAEAPECRLVFASSAELYGRSFLRGAPLDEDAPAAPANLYAATKAAADLALGAMAGEGLRVVRLRAFNHTGPGQTADFAVPAFARQVARIEAGLQPPALRVGALDPMRDFLDVRDVCAAYVAALRAELDAGAVLNIASGTPRRIGDVLRALLALAGLRAAIETAAGALRPSEIPFACGDARRARAALGWAPRIAWEQTLRDVLEDWRARVAARGEAA